MRQFVEHGASFVCSLVIHQTASKTITMNFSKMNFVVPSYSSCTIGQILKLPCLLGVNKLNNSILFGAWLVQYKIQYIVISIC